MKKIFSLGAILCLLGAQFMTSCSDFLEEPPQGNLTQEDFPSTESEALLATNAAYSTLRNWFYHSGGYPILDVMSDDAYKGSNPNDQESNVGPYDNFQMTASQDGLDRWWSSLYEGIRYTNVVIEKVPGISMDAAKQANYLAQAKFLRALYYFDLVRAWGGVPLVTVSAPPLREPRATADEVYALIIDDLTFAIANLPNQNELEANDVGRATKGAANALMAKVYLFRQDFAKAEQFALDVIQSNNYALDPDFGHTFSIFGQFNSESIFEIGAIGKEGSDNGGNQYGNNQGVRGTPNKGWGFNRPSIDLQNSFEPNDPRKDQTIIFLGETLDGVLIQGDGNTPDITYSDPPTNSIIKEIECYNQKVWVPGTSTLEGWGHNRRLIRYADVLLIAAEALNENNKPADALVYLNKVRERARQGIAGVLPDVTEMDKMLLRELIWKERRAELAMEGHRFWDLVRTGRAEAVLGPLGFIKDKNELLPIPQSEIDISEGTISQNLNW